MNNQSTIARGDLRAYEESVRLATPELVERLRDLLGAKLVAYLGSVQETRAVRQWADPADARTPSTEVVNRLRMAYRIAALLRGKDSAAVVQTWFQGMNPRLGDVARRGCCVRATWSRSAPRSWRPRARSLQQGDPAGGRGT
ncbi:hypothetical protein [Pimelobacter simplex]|uniref:hypothetical protein n=1 Tax=Nocardioides simplex TaxID=2045 RepID=UPI001C203108|nr:hypothetical protein [Pimelobacter simplex]